MRAWGRGTVGQPDVTMTRTPGWCRAIGSQWRAVELRLA